MSKEKDLKKYAGNKDGCDCIIPRGAFTADSAKIYILAFIIAFHILPLILAFCGDMGKSALNSIFMFYLNPMFVFAILLVYGIKVGFNAKMPLIGTVLSAISTVMYYNVAADTEMGILYYPLLTFSLSFITYGIMAFAGNLAGAVIRHFRIF